MAPNAAARRASAAEGAAIRAKLMRWYRANGRHTLPWRQTVDPYAVLISEVMLQQTQVERVLPYYERWLTLWPSFEALAAASPADVIREWAGLGYNRRALNLQRAAFAVCAEHAGALPRSMIAMRALPGIGPYTASAVACFARGERVVVADTNIARVLARLCLGQAAAKECTEGELHATAERLLPVRNARDHNLALMDLGAVMCSARSPRCEACPLQRECAWRAAGRPSADRVASSTPRFETTARYARGRIIDALRMRQHTSDELRTALPTGHHPKLPAYLSALEREGMVERVHRDSWALPSGNGVAAKA